MRRRHELSDEQWELIRDLLLGKAGDPGRTARSATASRHPRPFKLGLFATLRSAKRPSLIHPIPNITLGISTGGWAQAKTLLAEFEPKQVLHVVADAAYDSDAIRARVKKLRAKTCIKPIQARRIKKRYDKTRYRRRNVVERFFDRLKRFRRAATRYDKKPPNFAGFIWLAALILRTG